LRSAFIAFPLASSSGRKRSLIRTAPIGHETELASFRPERRIAWTLPPPMSMAKPFTTVVEFATAR
jgi:hypothetical protein